MRSSHAQINEELGDGLGRHRAASVGVQGELVAVDALAVDRVGDEGFGEFADLRGCDGPGDDAFRAALPIPRDYDSSIGTWALVPSTR